MLREQYVYYGQLKQSQNNKKWSAKAKAKKLK